MAARRHVGGPVRRERGRLVKVKVKFPITPVTRKAIREQLLLDTTGSGVEDAMLAAADAAKTPEQKTFVERTYSRAGRLSVWIVDDQPVKRGDGGIRGKKRALREALARVRL